MFFCFQQRHSDSSLLSLGQCCVGRFREEEIGIGMEKKSNNEAALSAEAGPKGSVAIIIATIPLIAMLGYAEITAVRSAPTNRVPPVSLGLSVSHINSGLTLSWNPAVPALRTAREAELVILDGNHTSRLFLSPDQIRGGNVIYAPFTPAVTFTLRAQDGGPDARDGILALDAASLPYTPDTQPDRAEPASNPAMPTLTMAPGAVTFPTSISQNPPAGPPGLAGYGKRLVDFAKKTVGIRSGPGEDRAP